MVVIADRAQQREQSILDQRFKLAWAHWKVEAAVRDYLRRPLNRLWDAQRKQQRQHRRKPTRVQFEGALCTDIRVFINVSPAHQYQKPASSIRIDAPESYVTRWSATEPNVIWHTPARTKFSVHKLSDPPLTVKRIPIDEVETLLDWEEHRIVQRQGGDTDNAWRRSLMIAGGVQEAAERAIWNQPAHQMFQPARQAAPVECEKAASPRHRTCHLGRTHP